MNFSLGHGDQPIARHRRRQVFGDDRAVVAANPPWKLCWWGFGDYLRRSQPTPVRRRIGTLRVPLQPAPHPPPPTAHTTRSVLRWAGSSGKLFGSCPRNRPRHLNRLCLP